MMNRKEIGAILRYAGAFIAWVIGSGFATGQEIFQFFSSYGIKSMGILAVDLIGFILLGAVLVVRGYDNRDNAFFDHYRDSCGSILGKVYQVVVPIILLLLISVLFSGFGAALEQYYSLDRHMGAAAMAVLILAVYFIGFEKMTRLFSKISPFVIAFTVFVGIYTVVRDFGGITEKMPEITEAQAAPHWFLSGVLYLSLNFLSGSVFYTELGKKAMSRKTAKIGAILGASVLMLTITVMTLAICLHAEAIVKVQVPTLYLAKTVSGLFGKAFSVVLMLGMFCSSAATLWSFCVGFFRYDRKKNAVFTVGTVAVCLLLGFVPFGALVSVAYPIIGYFGLPYIAGVLLIPLRKRKETRI